MEGEKGVRGGIAVEGKEGGSRGMFITGFWILLFLRKKVSSLLGKSPAGFGDMLETLAVAFCNI